MNFYSFASFKCEYFSFFSFFSSTKLRPRETRNDVHRCRQKLLNWTAKASRRIVVWIFPKEIPYRRLFPCCLRRSPDVHKTWTKSINKLPVVGIHAILSEYHRVGNNRTRSLFRRAECRPEMLFLRPSHRSVSFLLIAVIFISQLSAKM